MARSTLAASALILIAGAGTAATNGNGNASLPATRLASVVRAGHPNYVIGGWVCPPGFAWRNAGRQDWLCVEPAEARRVAWENQSAAENWVRVPDGSYGCRPGMVMRDAFKDDRVCVDPARRELVEKMNLALFDAR